MPEQAQYTIMVVDDSAVNLNILSELLQPCYQVRAATSGRIALEIARLPPYPDLILLDVMMPDMDGYQVFEQLRMIEAYQEIPVIFVTAMNTPESEMHGLGVGAVDYITKPIHPQILLARISTQLELKQARDWLRNQNAYLESEIAKRMADNELIQKVSIRALAHLAETRDPETGNHILRTQAYVQLLARQLQGHPRFAATLTEHYIHDLTLSAPLHDIGKVGIPDAILRKPGPLDPEEWTIMKTHAQLGSEAIIQAERDVPKPVEFLRLAKEIARWHHEKWDGTGYPDGLRGDEIPLSARIMALADVFDALISVRVYKPAMSYQAAGDIISAGSHNHFDPDIVAAFQTSFTQCCAIADQYRDSESNA